MVALRLQLTGASFAVPFGLSALSAAFAPTPIGYQDLAAMFVRRPAIAEHWRDGLMASPFGAVHAATFSFSRPIGTTMPEPPAVQQVNFDPASSPWPEELEAQPAFAIEYPKVNRRLKGDRLQIPVRAPAAGEPELHLPQLQSLGAPLQPPVAVQTIAIAPPGKGVDETKAPPAGLVAPALEQFEPHIFEGAGAAVSGVAAPAPPDRIARASDHGPPATSDRRLPAISDRDVPVVSDLAVPQEAGSGRLPDAGAVATDGPPELPAAGDSDTSASYAASLIDVDPAERNSQLYFGIAAMGARGVLEQWAPGAAPVLVRPIDPDMKLSALQKPTDYGDGGESVARKGDDVQLQSPAVRLGLSGKPRAKAEKCLADAIYFEARGEALRGQEAVAQVVMNRVFSGYYPHDVCGVVYQNSDRHLACQFTFACDGIPDVVNEPDMWEQAKRIARDTMDGKIWLSEVGHATHYHAYWVHPNWVNEMKKMYRLGVHTFYRPRAWGDGHDAPTWGDPETTAAIAKQL